MDMIPLSSDDNKLDKSNKFTKMRPIFYPINLSSDDEMVPYFGRHSGKMFMKGKVI